MSCAITLTDGECSHLLMLLDDNAQEGAYFGNRAQWEARHARLVAKLGGVAAPPRDAQPEERKP